MQKVDIEIAESLDFEISPHLSIFFETPENFVKKGLATAVCAALIEYCLTNCLIPSWEADTEASAKLAFKLGFSDPISYEAYYWYDPKS